MKQRQDFETRKEYYEYLLAYFSGLAMASLATDIRGNPDDVVKKSVAHAKLLLKELDIKPE